MNPSTSRRGVALGVALALILAIPAGVTLARRGMDAAGPAHPPAAVTLAARVQPVGVAGESVTAWASAMMLGSRSRGLTLDASATFRFSSGDVTIALEPIGRSLVARGVVPIPEDQTAGLVTVLVRVQAGGSTGQFELSTQVRAPEGEYEHQPET